jgi:hypothetical protein
MVVIGALILGFGVTALAGGLTVVDDIPGVFIDISGTGTPLDLSGNEEIEVFTLIGNDAFPAGRVIIANNGGIGFDPLIPDLEPGNEPIPSAAAFGGTLAFLPFWDDVGNNIGDVFIEQRPDRLIIQWHDHAFEDSEDTSRFQIQIFPDNLRPGPFDGAFNYAQMIYDDIEQPRAGGGASATIGYQSVNTFPFPTLQWSFDTPGAVSNGTVLSFISPEPGTIALVTIGGIALMRRRRAP